MKLQNTSLKPINAQIAGPPSFIRLIIETLRPDKIFRIKQQLIDEPEQTLLIIVLPDNCTLTFDELQPYLDFAIIGQPALSCMLHRSDWLIRQLRSGHPFYSFVCIQKNLLFDTGLIPLPDFSTELKELVLLKARRSFDHAFERSISFSEGAWFYFNNVSNLPLTMFMLHQSAELALRAVISSFCERAKRSHEIRILLRCAGYYLPSLYVSLAIDWELVKLLDQAYLKGRYAGDWIVSADQVNAALRMVDRLQLVVFESMAAFVSGI
ncbi:HEPN domain-containing protein [Pedobacter sp. HMF7647]|uniref:HEPN domain-containing protein n=1 Tax=Hufsiella arboris TaxID=2695275 RepID=A0A7K1YF82_9SPHI|nr:HEPN domain-containing protein [Hufsiella arboris]MXV53267.1 HEPN domain-containing protein [Hufsiella arboris]